MNEAVRVPRLEYDAEADALYIYLRDFEKVARTQHIGHSRNVDYDAEGNIPGVEFWNVQGGLDLGDVPERDIVTQVLEGQPFRVFV